MEFVGILRIWNNLTSSILVTKEFTQGMFITTKQQHSGIASGKRSDTQQNLILYLGIYQSDLSRGSGVELAVVFT